ncbi:uncharacterized protein [Chelonus insularis]|nr:uncharacterized protein LOC118066266 isoform X2 [Chelonus insularis]
MASYEDNSLKNLRQKSQVLLNRLQKNSNHIIKELQNLKLQSSSRTITSNHHACKSGNHCISSAQQTQHNSNQVTGTYCPNLNYQSLSHKLQNQGDMTVGGRILITSKRPVEVEPLRKPVKGCYCYHNKKKIQIRSPRSATKSIWPCNYCKSHFNVELPDSQETQNEISSPTLSCDTLRKVQKINYTPRSEFLRRVQQKASQNYNLCRSCSEPAVQPTRVARNIVDDPLDTIEVDSRYAENVKSKESDPNLRPKSKRNGEKHSPEIETIFTANASSRPTSSGILMKKTICSSKSIDENIECGEEESLKRVRSKNKLKSRTLTQKSCQYDCCSVNARRKSPKKNKKTGQETCLQCHRCPGRCPSKFVASGSSDHEDEEVIKLRKFREKNYYDTHGSSSALLSSLDSSTRLKQYEINDRLFPVPVDGIYDDEAQPVVSMPRCATKQFKRVHYFPQFIVKQDERAAGLSKSSGKKHQKCPLTGHAIDIRRLKTPSKNSLACKFRYEDQFDDYLGYF